MSNYCNSHSHPPCEGASEPRISLSKAEKGKRYRIVALMAGRGLGRRLTSLGLNINATIIPLQQRAGGAMIIARGDTRIALGSGMSNKILVEVVPDPLPVSCPLTEGRP